MSTLRIRRLFAIVGSLMIGAGTGAAADALTRGDAAMGPILPMLLAGLGLGVLSASAMRDEAT